ncbi:energy transducer TonB [Flavobacterium sp. ov086]|uniref:energy transducer TonB n=1 Tax=Flavobacterium sp. ov086 TaxID=1761785 RepID=UPI000B6A7EAF|nr:energy transducer TonB [Flavobacterium sp. ov086]SNR51424.1 TonB protein C-terminal [Flavobacterium sp. ov086]
MKTIILIFLSLFSIANGQNQKTNTAVRDITLKIPEGYTKRKWVEPYSICVQDLIPYNYNFEKKVNQVYLEGQLIPIDGVDFQNIQDGYFKNRSSVYYYTREFGLQKIPDMDVASTKTFNSFIADKNFLYIKNSKVIGSGGLKLVSDYKSYKEAVSLKNTNNNSFADYYLFKNNKGYWIIKVSDVVSYNFLGKTYDHKWDIIYEKDEDGKLDDTIYNIVGIDVKPEFPGGIAKFYDFANNNFKLEEKDIVGRAYATFVVEKDGSLSDIKILRDIGYGSGKELIRVLKLSPKWSPGIKNGKKIRCLYSIPYTINASLD